MLLETDELIEVLSFLKMMGPALGINLQPLKVKVLLPQQEDYLTGQSIHCRLTTPGGSHRLDPQNVILHPSNDPFLPYSQYGAVLLGSPIGTDEYCINFFKDVLNKLRVEANHITSLEDTQSAFLLLKYCFSQKIQHFLRTVPPYLTMPHLAKPFNDLLRCTLTKLLKLDHLTDMEFQQALLDISEGGLGIGVHPFTAHVSFSGSFIESFSSIEEKIRSIRTSINHQVLSLRTKSLSITFNIILTMQTLF